MDSTITNIRHQLIAYGVDPQTAALAATALARGELNSPIVRAAHEQVTGK